MNTYIVRVPGTRIRRAEDSWTPDGEQLQETLSTLMDSIDTNEERIVSVVPRQSGYGHGLANTGQEMGRVVQSWGGGFGYSFTTHILFVTESAE